MVEEEVEVDVEIKSTADKFHMFVRRSQHVSKATRYIQGCDLLEDGEPRLSKDRIEGIDVETNVIKWRVLEGPLKKEYKSFLKTMKVSPKQGGTGSVVKWNMKYERIDEKVVHPERLLKFFVEVITEVDQYHLSED